MTTINDCGEAPARPDDGVLTADQVRFFVLHELRARRQRQWLDAEYALPRRTREADRRYRSICRVELAITALVYGEWGTWSPW